MTDTSVSYQVEEAIVILQYWITSYCNSLSAQSLIDPIGAANVIVRGLGVLGTVAGSIALFFNYNNEKKKRLQENTKNRNDARLTEARLTSERFSKAVEQIGSKSIHTRLGGIYSFEKIAQESPEEHWPIMEILTAFIREESSMQSAQLVERKHTNIQVEMTYSSELKGIEIDIQAALTVISRRDELRDKGSLNLSSTNLVKAKLIKAKFDGADLTGTDLSYADLTDAHLKGTDFRFATVIRAKFNRANLIDSNLTVAQFSHSKFRGAQLEKANLGGSDLRGTEFHNADLTKASIGATRLQNAIFYEAKLVKASLSASNLNGTHFTKSDLTQAGFESATLDRTYFNQAVINGTRFDKKSLSGGIFDEKALERAEIS